jgi:hypothetical protein
MNSQVFSISSKIVYRLVTTNFCSMSNISKSEMQNVYLIKKNEVNMTTRTWLALGLLRASVSSIFSPHVTEHIFALVIK